MMDTQMTGNFDFDGILRAEYGVLRYEDGMR
jgi:hypothetical protein